MFFMCVYITDISAYLVVIMLLCRYVASVDQALRDLSSFATETVTLEENKHLGNCDYFTIFPSC